MLYIYVEIFVADHYHHNYCDIRYATWRAYDGEALSEKYMHLRRGLSQQQEYNRSRMTYI
jgi:hypothetical protein